MERNRGEEIISYAILKEGNGMKYYVTITRLESFLIQAEEAEEALDIAFTATAIRPEAILEHDIEAISHTVEEQ